MKQCRNISDSTFFRHLRGAEKSKYQLNIDDVFRDFELFRDRTNNEFILGDTLRYTFIHKDEHSIY